MEVKIELRNVYGKQNIYVVSPNAQTIKSLTRKQTVDATDLRSLKALGMTIVGASEAATQFIETAVQG